MRARTSLMQRDLRYVIDGGYRLVDCTLCESEEGAYLGIKHGERWLIRDSMLRTSPASLEAYNVG